jgi:general secretion pathway protein G
MFGTVNTARRGFSLIELVIVVVIIGIIAAIAIPRMSRGAAGAGDAALSSNLAVLRSAIDLYHTEHGGQDSSYPSAANIAAQLMGYTDESGAVAPKDSTHIYGPYLRSIPPLPVGAKKGSTGIAAADGAGVGWIYTAATGTIVSNTTGAEVDVRGKAYNTY